jgi:hypothetical protein
VRTSRLRMGDRYPQAPRSLAVRGAPPARSAPPGRRPARASPSPGRCRAAEGCRRTVSSWAEPAAGPAVRVTSRAEPARTTSPAATASSASTTTSTGTTTQRRRNRRRRGRCVLPVRRTCLRGAGGARGAVRPRPPALPRRSARWRRLVAGVPGDGPEHGRRRGRQGPQVRGVDPLPSRARARPRVSPAGRRGDQGRRPRRARAACSSWRACSAVIRCVRVPW